MRSPTPQLVLLAAALLLAVPAQADFDFAGSLRASESAEQAEAAAARSARRTEARDRMIADIRRHTEKLKLQLAGKQARPLTFSWREQKSERALELLQRLDEPGLSSSPGKAAQRYRLGRDRRRALDGEARRRVRVIERQRLQRDLSRPGDPGASPYRPWR